MACWVSGHCGLNEPALRLAADHGIRWLLAAIFAASCLGKLNGIYRFQEALEDYRLLPDTLLTPVTYAIPVMEFAVTVSWIIGRLVPLAAWTTIAMLVLFSGAMLIGLAGHRRMACGCSGFSASRDAGWLPIARNVALICFACIVLWLELVLHVSPLPPLGLTDSVIALGVTLLLALFVLGGESLVIVGRELAATG